MYPLLRDEVRNGLIELDQSVSRDRKSVVIVANLKPRTLCGVESKGMVLAGEITEDDIKVLFVDGMPAGTMLG